MMPSHFAKSRRFWAAALAVGLTAFLAAMALPALAQPNLGLEYAAGTGLGTQDIRVTVARIINIFLGLLGIVAVGLMVYAGFLWMTSAGSEEQVTKAKLIIRNAVIGLIIILSAYAIVSFVFRAAIEGTMGEGGCAPGQDCSGGGGGFDASGRNFQVSATIPLGAGSGLRGWPKNYAIKLNFNDLLDEGSLANNFKVWQCNSRLQGDTPQALQVSDCHLTQADRLMPGSPLKDGDSRLAFRPNRTDVAPDAANDKPEYFVGDYWYYVQAHGGIGGIRNARAPASNLACLPVLLDDDLTNPQKNTLCDRAVAFNDIVDLTPPQVTINTPASPPGYCTDLIPVQAKATDDFAPFRVTFSLEFPAGVSGDAAALQAALVDAAGNPASEFVNLELTPEFVVDGLFIDTTKLEAGRDYVLRAAVEDGAQPGTPATSRFRVNPPYCCDGVKTPNTDELGPDCGPSCGGACPDSNCTEDGDCASGACIEGKCVELPIIDSVEPADGAKGNLITFTGRFFGTAAGSVFFTDNQQAAPCAAGAWTPTQVVVKVPEGAVTGPLKLTRADGKSDDTTDVTPGWAGDFTVNDSVRPGICFVDPNAGRKGSEFVVNGAGFGATPQVNLGDGVFLGSNEATVTAGGWGTGGDRIAAVVPALSDAAYRVIARAGGVDSNPSSFTIRPEPGEETPRVTDISPSAGPIESYVTITGSGFGDETGIVRFISKTGQGQARAVLPPATCGDNWKRNYIVIKVPSQYDEDCPNDPDCAVKPGAMSVQIETSAGKKSNLIDFRVNTDSLKPGICGISPDKAPAGYGPVTVLGERFGNGPGQKADPRNTVDFFAGQGVDLPSSAYSAWSDSAIQAGVPKNPDAKSGPVTVTAMNQASGNSIPFAVVNCQDQPSACDTSETCCPSGACLSKDVGCDVERPKSAFGWRLSTEIMPRLPVVLTCAGCREGQCPDTSDLASPMPIPRTQENCINTNIQAAFSQAMDSDFFNADTISVTACGSAANPACSGADLPFTATAETLEVGTLLDLTMMNDFTAGTWYRVQLISDAANPAKSIKNLSGALLDGDYDDQPGGNYEFVFRTRADAARCVPDDIAVSPAAYLITFWGPPSSYFRANLRNKTNCNVLRCRTNETEFAIAWQPDSNPDMDGVLAIGSTERVACPNDRQPVQALKETFVGDVYVLTSKLSVTNGFTASDDSEIDVKFTAPAVTAFRPDCEEACVNSEVSADFNVPMAAASLNANNFEIQRCRNAACTAPFAAPQLGWSVEMPISQLVQGDQVVDVYRQAVIKLADHCSQSLKACDENADCEDDETCTSDLQAGQYYVVKVIGGGNGVKSMSGRALTGTNEGDSFVWTFRTKDSATPCKPDRTELQPKKTTLRFVGERAGFTAAVFGSPDTCSATGQVLDAWRENWIWQQSDGLPLGDVIGGFVRAQAPLDADGRLDTNPTGAAGCTGQCLHAGSQVKTAVCGNGIVEANQGEQCDDGNANPNDGCGTSCLLTGSSAASCGDGDLKASEGEACEAVIQTDGSKKFPAGCLAPLVGVTKGCIHTGSSTAPGSICGDGLITDGEDCDDGNRQNGDGCSADCSREGSRISCHLAPDDPLCVSYCGNGETEAGEDPGCDVAAGDGAWQKILEAGCDPNTCLKFGSDLCGNGVLDAGEECEVVAGRLPDGCSERCLWAGSSYRYDTPSFCRDRISGVGEECEITGQPDGLIDPFQVIEGGSPLDTPPKEATVRAYVADVKTAGKQGTATVAMECVCNQQAEPQAYCSGLVLGDDPDLGCDKNGCCAPAPTVESVYPRDQQQDACPNTVVKVTFDQDMDRAAIERGLMLGEAIEGETCPKHCAQDAVKTCIEDKDCGSGDVCNVTDPLRPTSYQPAPAEPAPRGWAAAWRQVVNFFRRLFATEASAQISPNPSGYVYCPVLGTTQLRGRTAVFSPNGALKSTTLYRVLANGVSDVDFDHAVVSLKGVPLKASYNSYFQTAPDICKIERVSLTPPSQLFTTAEDLGMGDEKDKLDGDEDFTAIAHPTGTDTEAEIQPTPEYDFTWYWYPQPADSEITMSVPMLVPVAGNGRCEYAPVCTQNPTKLCAGDDQCLAQGTCGLSDPPGSADCSKPVVNGQSAVCGNGACEIGETRETCATDCAVPAPRQNVAKVAVRQEPAAEGFPRNGERSVKVAALIYEDGTYAGSESAYADVTVMLCDNPWPERRSECENNTYALPWDLAYPQECVSGNYPWSPFYDRETNVSFYYCRDGAQGDETELLPYILEDSLKRQLKPGRDILKEYLFTFDGSRWPAVQPAPKWLKNALGWRIVTNLGHQSLQDWYRGQGFRGSPSAKVVSGYDAMSEGRTTYASSAALTDDLKLFTNVNVLSYSEGAEAETVTVFNQILKNINFNKNLRDERYCQDAAGQPAVEAESPDIAMACTSDRDCRLKTGTQEFDGAKAGFVCVANKSKLIRDTRRWVQLLGLRQAIADKGAGNYPKLEAGSFLRARTSSAWPSWSAVLGRDLGTTAPADPLNWYLSCAEADKSYDQKTCWDAANKTYKCPAGSHVYQYTSVGGADFTLTADFETLQPSQCGLFDNEADCNDQGGLCTWSGESCAVGVVNWSGNTCLEKAQADCAGPICVWREALDSVDDNRRCQFADGGTLVIAGVNLKQSATCVDEVFGASGTCGDGIVQPDAGEACEPAQAPAVQGCDKSNFCQANQALNCEDDNSCKVNGQNYGPCVKAVYHGSQQRVCQTNCSWPQQWGACFVGYCGDGVIQSPEKCDDGPLNGAYGKCKSDCSNYGFRCGDEDVQPGEACDCGPNNGVYDFNAGQAVSGFEPIVPLLPSGLRGLGGFAPLFNLRH